MTTTSHFSTDALRIFIVCHCFVKDCDHLCVSTIVMGNKYVSGAEYHGQNDTFSDKLTSTTVN